MVFVIILRLFSFLTACLLSGLPVILFSQPVSKNAINALPPAIKTELGKTYSKYSITRIEKTDSGATGTGYKISLRRKTRLVYLHFDSNSNLFLKEKERIFTYDGTEKEYEKHDEKTNNTVPQQHFH